MDNSDYLIEIKQLWAVNVILVAMLVLEVL